MTEDQQNNPFIEFLKKKTTLNYLISFVVCVCLFYPIEYHLNGPNLPSEKSLGAAIAGALFAAGILSAIVTFFTMSSSSYWLKPIVELIVLISRADGKITVNDQKVIIQALKSQFGYFKAKRAYRYFQKVKESNAISIKMACGKLNQVFEASNATVLLDEIVKIAVADRYMSREEERIIREIAEKLRVKTSVLNSILARRNFAWESKRNTHQQKKRTKTNSTTSAFSRSFEVLGVPENSNFDEVKKAYRNLAKIYHPDKVMNGVNKTMAKKQFQAISDAYQLLKQRLG